MDLSPIYLAVQFLGRQSIILQKLIHPIVREHLVAKKIYTLFEVTYVWSFIENGKYSSER